MVVFRNQQPNPLKVLFYQKAIFKGIALANQERIESTFSFHHDYRNHSRWTQSIQHMSSLGEINTEPINTEAWNLFMKVKKTKRKSWYGAGIIIRSPTGLSIVICRSLDVSSKKHTQLIILREAFLRLKEFEATTILCRDLKRKWRRLIQPNNVVNWKIFPVFIDIISLCSPLQVRCCQEWHSLAKEMSKLANKASFIHVSISWS